LIIGGVLAAGLGVCGICYAISYWRSRRYSSIGDDPASLYEPIVVSGGGGPQGRGEEPGRRVMDYFRRGQREQITPPSSN